MTFFMHAIKIEQILCEGKSNTIFLHCDVCIDNTTDAEAQMVQANNEQMWLFENYE